MGKPRIKILWADDEIDLLKPHVIFLETKGYKVITATNGEDALDAVVRENFDIIFLDENMPGLSGLETLEKMKHFLPSVPVVMITKSEEEDIMDEAIGSHISDYLIKPVNPKQILLAIKKNIDQKRLVEEATTQKYQMEFGKIGLQIAQAQCFEDWTHIYKKIVYWELELENSGQTDMKEILLTQKAEANNEFCKYIKTHYKSWFDPANEIRPLLSPNVFKEVVFPMLGKTSKVVLLVMDNLRYDQYRILLPFINEYYQLFEEKVYCGILPTTTQFARNAMFAGLMPMEIEKMFPEYWVNEEEEEGKNLYEESLLKKQMQRLGINASIYYEKVNNLRTGTKLSENVQKILPYDLTVIVYNFVDLLSHSRTEMDVIRELANDEAAYRSLTLSWFNHSPLNTLLKELANQDIRLVLTTDHGSIKITNPLKIIGDKNTSVNLRYKQGKSLNYNPKNVLDVSDPSRFHLPKSNVSSRYIFAMANDFFAYRNNYNYYVNYYKNTFQHGGISMEEMIIPISVFIPRK